MPHRQRSVPPIARCEAHGLGDGCTLDDSTVRFFYPHMSWCTRGYARVDTAGTRGL